MSFAAKYQILIDLGSIGIFELFGCRFPSKIASKTDARINAEKVVEMRGETVLESMRNLLKFMGIPLNIIEKTTVFNNPKNSVFCFLYVLCSSQFVRNVAPLCPVCTDFIEHQFQFGYLLGAGLGIYVSSQFYLLVFVFVCVFVLLLLSHGIRIVS